MYTVVTTAPLPWGGTGYSFFWFPFLTEGLSYSLLAQDYLQRRKMTVDHCLNFAEPQSPIVTVTVFLATEVPSFRPICETLSSHTGTYWTWTQCT